MYGNNNGGNIDIASLLSSFGPNNTGGGNQDLLSQLNFGNSNDGNNDFFGGFFDGFFDGDTLTNSLTGLAQIMGAWGGLQQLNLAKDQFKFNKGAFNTNLANQANLTNSQLSDRQDRRVADAALNGANAQPVTSTADYLRQFGASGTVGV